MGLANSVCLILLLIFSGAAWGQSKSPQAPVLEPGHTQSFEKREKFSEGPIEQPSRNAIELPAFEKRGKSRLGSDTDDLRKHNGKMNQEVTDTAVKPDVLLKSYLEKDPFGQKNKPEWPSYENYGNSIESSHQFSGQIKPMESIKNSLVKSIVDDDDSYKDEEIDERAKELLKKYKRIEGVPMSILDEDSDVEKKLKEYLLKKKSE
jgi:hypothetical protein